MDHNSLYAWVGGWCLTGPAKKNACFFFRPQRGFGTYIILTEIWQLQKTGKPLGH